MSDAQPMPSSCPTDLEIGDLIAGRLSGEARERIMGHLAACEECYEIFAEAQELLTEVESGTPPASGDEAPTEAVTAPLLPFPPRRQGAASGWLVGLSASVMVGVALAWWLPESQTGSGPSAWPRLGSLRFAASTAITPIPGGTEDRRGHGRLLSRIAADFRLGASWAHLEAAVYGGNREETQTSAAQLQAALIEYFTAGELTAELRNEIGKLLDALKSLGEQLPSNAVQDLEAATARISREMNLLGCEFDLGRFAEAGRLAAEAGSLEFFDRQGPAARYLREIATFAAENPAQTQIAQWTLEGLAAITAVWPTEDAVPGQPLPLIAAAFTDLIRAFQDFAFREELRQRIPPT